MKIKHIADKLKQHNEWRREDNIDPHTRLPMMNPEELGEVIDAAEAKLREILDMLPEIKELVKTDIEGFGEEKYGWLLKKIEQWENN